MGMLGDGGDVDDAIREVEGECVKFNSILLWKRHCNLEMRLLH
jgi:hypothetical protein